VENGRTATIGGLHGVRSRLAALLLAAILAACGSSGAPGSSPGASGGSTAPSPAAGSTATPTGPALPDAAIRSVTYSEDPASPLLAVAELDPNEADVERLEFYRDAAGALRSVVAYHGASAPSVLTFTADGLLSTVKSNGHHVDFAYTATEVEAAITNPEGTVVTEHGQIQAMPEGALPAVPLGHAASFRTVLAEPGMVAYPMVVESFGVVPIEVRYSGKSRDSYSKHLTFENEVCVPGEGLNCDARLMTMWRDGQPTLVALVNTWIQTPVDPAMPGVIWRTRADCESFTSTWEKSLKYSSWLQFGAAALMAGATLLLRYSNPALSVTIFLVGASIKVLGSGTEALLPKDCGLAPNLLEAREAALDQKGGATSLLRVKAIDDCAPGRTAAWRVKEPKNRELSIQPLLRVNQSRLDQPGSGPELAYLPQMGTLTVDAADCAREMTGKVDLKPLYPTAKALAAIEKLVTENRASLTFAEVDGNPDTRATVTGEIRMTITLDGPFLWRIHQSVGQEVFNVDANPMPPEWSDCSITSTTIATLKGRQSAVGNRDVTGRAAVTATSTISGCEDTNSNLKAGEDPAPLENVAWKAEGDDGLMRGVVHLKGLTKSNTYDLTFFVVRPKTQ
jgi:hypothetical protein